MSAAKLDGANLDNVSMRPSLFRRVVNALPRPRQIILNVNPPRQEAPPLPYNNNNTPWTQDADCVGEEDPVSMDTISEGRGFRLQAENRCYDVETMAQMKRLRRPLVGPMTRNPFTPEDKKRIDSYIRDHLHPPAPTGGKTRATHKKRKTKKTRKTKRFARKTRKTTRRHT